MLRPCLRRSCATPLLSLARCHLHHRESAPPPPFTSLPLLYFSRKTPRNPDYQPEAIYAHDMPPHPVDDDSGWAFHHWVLGTKRWDAYRNKYGVPVELGMDGASRWNADPNFSVDELPPFDTDAEVTGSHIPRYGVEMEHDFEAGGSASQTTNGFVSALFGAPPPATFTPSWEQDTWEQRIGPIDAQSAGPFDPWVAGTGTQHMYVKSPDGGYEDMRDESGEEDLGDVSPQRQTQRRVQPHRDGKGVAATRFDPSGRKRRK